MATSGAASIDKYCTFLFHTEKAAAVQQDEIIKKLESSDNSNKCEALKQSIMLLLSGEQLPRVLMTVIRSCINTQDHDLKKLLMLYWEVVPKYGPDGKLLPEMILVCNALRNDLNHPNEYIRGSMLRFICKLKEPELLEPLIPSIKQCLEHRHSYVRRNAAIAIYSIRKAFGDQLLPDAADMMAKFIEQETDMSARRNAFLMLFNDAEAIATDFLQDHIDDLHKFGDVFALLVLELTRKVCRRDPAQKSRFIRAMFQLLQSTSAAVSYEAAWTLVSLSSAPTAVRAAAQTYARLLTSQSDNNLRLIILERLDELRKFHSKIVQEILMDIMRVLSTPNLDICKKTLSIVTDLVSPRNIEEVMQVLKREVVRTQEADMDNRDEYRHLLVQTIHTCAVKFPDVAESVVQVLLDFVAGSGGLDILLFTRTILEQFPHLRGPVLKKLCVNFDEVTTAAAMRVALWVMGEYGNDANLLVECHDEIMRNLGTAPFLEAEGDKSKGSEVQMTTITKNVVLADGTYATQTITQAAGATVVGDSVLPLRRLVCGGDALLGTVAVVSLTKLALRALQQQGALADMARNYAADAVLGACGIARLADTKSEGRVAAYADCMDRLTMCCRVLLDTNVRAEILDSVLEGGRAAFAAMVAKQKAARQKELAQQSKGPQLQPDDLIQFRQLRAQAVQGGLDLDLMDGDDISRAVGVGDESDEANKIKRVYQLTGYSDPVYAEASVTVHDYDIVLDMLVVNRTPNTLTNLTLELATMGDLRLVERPQSYTIGPLDERRIRANIKVSSTEAGHIFGTIVFDNSSSAQKTYILLNDIQLDVMDYIRPARCTDQEFRAMWAEFEWENKVAVATSFTDLHEFLQHIIAHTNMSCLTPLSNDVNDTYTNFLAANLHARSVFGEDALVNVSVEKKDDADGRLSGYIRIRSKTQGIALSLGDRITSVQRGSAVQIQP